MYMDSITYIYTMNWPVKIFNLFQNSFTNDSNVLQVNCFRGNFLAHKFDHQQSFLINYHISSINSVHRSQTVQTFSKWIVLKRSANVLTSFKWFLWWFYDFHHSSCEFSTILFHFVIWSIFVILYNWIS